MIERAARAGHVANARGQISASQLVSADHPKGVRSLPPTLRADESQRAGYLAIGESEPMTWGFRKPRDACP